MFLNFKSILNQFKNSKQLKSLKEHSNKYFKLYQIIGFPLLFSLVPIILRSKVKNIIGPFYMF